MITDAQVMIRVLFDGQHVKPADSISARLIRHCSSLTRDWGTMEEFERDVAPAIKAHGWGWSITVTSAAVPRTV